MGYLHEVRLLEGLQRRWTREITDVSFLEYTDRLRVLDMFSVYGRLMRIDLVKIWKASNSNDVEILSFQEG